MKSITGIAALALILTPAAEAATFYDLAGQGVVTSLFSEVPGGVAYTVGSQVTFHFYYEQPQFPSSVDPTSYTYGSNITSALQVGPTQLFVPGSTTLQNFYPAPDNSRLLVSTGTSSSSQLTVDLRGEVFYSFNYPNLPEAAVIALEDDVPSLGSFLYSTVVGGTSYRTLGQFQITSLLYVSETDPPPAVPLPAAAWLLLSGIGCLAAVRRRRAAS